MRELRDIKDMPNFNPAVPNGLDNVSKGEVYFGICRVGQYNGFRELSLPTVVCDEHGAMLCVALTKSEDGNMIEKIWRCPTCNKGAYELSGDEGEELYKLTAMFTKEEFEKLDDSIKYRCISVVDENGDIILASKDLAVFLK